MTENRVGAANEESNIATKGNSDGDKVNTNVIVVYNWMFRNPIHSAILIHSIKFINVFAEKCVLGRVQIDQGVWFSCINI